MPAGRSLDRTQVSPVGNSLNRTQVLEDTHPRDPRGSEAPDPARPSLPCPW